jgi:DNA-binding transcriptional ArsR family regulator
VSVVAFSDQMLDLVARRLRVLADPTRLRILALLGEREATVKELTDELSTTPQNVSKHLALLHQTGIVTRRKDGNWVQYALADYAACRLVEQAGASVTAYAEELAEAAGLEVAAAQR